jgi:DNA replication protein DnaC
MKVRYGRVARRLFGYDFVDMADGTKIRLVGASIAPDIRLQFLAGGAGKPAAWLAESSENGSTKRKILSALAEIRDSGADEAIRRFAASIVAGTREPMSSVPGIPPVSATGRPAGGEDSFVKAIGELLSDTRLDEDAALDLAACPLTLAHAESLAPFISSLIAEKLARKLELVKRWMDLDAEPPEWLAPMTIALLDPESSESLKSGRREAQESRIEAARLAAEEVQAREHARREREEALRKALQSAGRRGEAGKFEMTEEFQRVFELIEEGEKMLFVTGKPGTGKSTLVRALRERLSHRNLIVLSFTGTAALNVGGQTINSFFMMPPRLLELGWANGTHTFRNRARALEIMIVDEVSMVRPDMMDAMDSSLRQARGDSRPFGGVQVVLVGDLYQLPPVVENQAAIRDYFEKTYGVERFFYAARAIREREPVMVELSQVFRQTQKEFLDFLADIRKGRIDGERIDAFCRRIRDLPAFGDSDFHVIVCPRRATAAGHNERFLRALPGDPARYAACLSGEVPDYGSAGPDGGTRTPADLVLELKTSAQVMFIKNDEGHRWVNGDLGIVESLEAERVTVTTRAGSFRVERAKWPIVKYDLDEETGRLVPREVGSFSQFPLRLAWASTIHKMQGQTVDRIKIDLSGGAFEAGMTYVALSRCRTMEGIRLTRPLVAADLVVDAGVLRYLDSVKIRT